MLTRSVLVLVLPNMVGRYDLLLSETGVGMVTSGSGLVRHLYRYFVISICMDTVLMFL